MSVRTGRSKMAVVAAGLMAAASMWSGTSAFATVYMTSGYTPGTPGTPGNPIGTPAMPVVAGTLIQSFNPAALTESSLTWTRPVESTSEVDPLPPTVLDSSTGAQYYYSTVTFTVPASQRVDYYQSSSFDGFLHIYAGGFDPSNPFANLVGGDDDMTRLLGGTVPNNGGVGAGSFPDSGLRFNASPGVTYTAVSSTYASTASTLTPLNGGLLYSELRTEGFDGTPAIPGTGPTAGTQGSPVTPIPDNSPETPAVLTLNVATHGTITSFNRFNLIDAVHTYVSDLDMVLSHNGVDVYILSAQGGSGDWLAGLTYQFTDSGVAYPGGANNAYGNYDYRSLESLSAFAGMDVFGDWVLTVMDFANLDTGSIGAFSIDVTAGAGTPSIPGDYNGDGVVDAADYTVWADHFGQMGSGLAGDGNNDGVVDAADYTVWADHFGQGSGPGGVSAVPEPTALALALPAVSLLGRRRRA